MTELANEVVTVNIEDELQQSYLDYAMSVIVGRALPDVRDGLKPVHRRVLYAMHEMSNDWNKPYKKSARVVGDVIGKYHPHGDSAVYDTIVRMAQPFSLRYMLVDGQGNFGSVDGDSAAAMRYTEVRMAKITHELLADLEKDTVDFVLNYDENEREPSVLPTKIPNLLVNGSSGIAVGMATNIPPHNLTEVINACLALIDEPDISLEGLMEHMPGPDFPTAGIISGRSGIYRAYKTGRGRVYVRAKANFEEYDNGRIAIIVTELPYQINKARLIEKIAELVKDKKIEGISGLRDESDKDGMRVVIELKRGEVPEVVLNNLYKQTYLQSVFGINMVALVDNQPRQLPLKDILEAFVRHRRQVVTRRTLFDLKKARDRAHVLEGLAVALANIDPVIQLIKIAKNPAEAKVQLLEQVWAPGQVMSMLDKADADVTRPRELEPQYGLKEDGYHLSPAQAQAILDLRLHRLTGLEQDKIISEYKDIITLIKGLLNIISSNERLYAVIKQELIEIRDQFGDERRTQIVEAEHDLTDEDLITQEEVVVTLSHAGYIKSQPISLYQAQHRGGKGKAATRIKDDDFIEKVLVTNTHNTILCFSSRGKVYWLKTYQLPQAGRTSRGKPIVNLLPLEGNEYIQAILPVDSYTENCYVVMATEKGTIKKTALELFSRPRSSGIIALDIADDDRVVGVELAEEIDDLMLFSDAGKAVRFNSSTIRPMGRTARGVRGIKLKPKQKVISLLKPSQEGAILTATQHGYGKRTSVDDYPVHGRGGQGVISIQVNERNGDVIGACVVQETDEIMLVSDHGKLVRLRAEDISIISRNTQGVRLINLSEGEKVVAVERVEEMAEEDIEK